MSAALCKEGSWLPRHIPPRRRAAQAAIAKRIALRDRDCHHSHTDMLRYFHIGPGTGAVFPHYVLEGRHRNPAVPIKAMRCNARMALIVLETERVHFKVRNWTTAMPPNEEGFISGVSIRHSVTPDAVRTILRALRSGGGTMAQFSHPDFGGMSQWAPGMTMVGDMFNNALKSKLDALCTELAAYVAQSAPADQRGGEDMAVSYRAARQRSDWWPANLGPPSAVGAQNDLEYAVFPNSRRLVIKDGGRIDIYDTGNHRIFGVAQAQSADQTLTFTSQDGLVRVKDLPKVRDGS